MTINERLDRAIKGQKLNNKQAAEMFGVSDQTVSNWRKGKGINGESRVAMVKDFIEAYEANHPELVSEPDPEPVQEPDPEPRRVPDTDDPGSWLYEFTILTRDGAQFRVWADEFKIHPEEGLVCFLLTGRRVALFRLEDVKGVF